MSIKVVTVSVQQLTSASSLHAIDMCAALRVVHSTVSTPSVDSSSNPSSASTLPAWCTVNGVCTTVCYIDVTAA
jgi:hypothetical protein